MLRSEMRSLRTAENFAGMSHRTLGHNIGRDSGMGWIPHKWKFEVDKSP